MENNKKTTLIRIDVETHERLRELAYQSRMTIIELVKRMVLEEENKRATANK